MAVVEQQKSALVVVQCFPPLLKNAGGVSKRYLSLCRALIDGLGWRVSLLTPVDVSRSKEPEVERWLAEGSLEHVRARGVRITSSTDGVAVFLDLMSGMNARNICYELGCRRHDAVFTDDTPWRLVLLLLARGLGIPAVVTTHTDITHMQSYKGAVKVAWQAHMLSTHLAAVHAAVSRVFAEQMRQMYGVPVGGIWPVCLWSDVFREEPARFEAEALKLRQSWLAQLREQGLQEPRAIMLNAGRWSAEKRIHLLLDAVPSDCALVIVGDGTSDYADMVANAGPPSRRNVLAQRQMLSAHELRVAYAAADLFLTASDFETLGFTIVEAWCSGTPVAAQPAQGHLEFVKDGVNSWFVDYNHKAEARATLERIVASGLEESSLQQNIPEFAGMGRKIRKSNYAEDLFQGVIAPALAEGVAMSEFGPIEIMKRFFALFFCLILWPILWLSTRCAFMTLKDPQFDVIGPLGSAVDDRAPDLVATLPIFRACKSLLVCLRII